MAVKVDRVGDSLPSGAKEEYHDSRRRPLLYRERRQRNRCAVTRWPKPISNIAVIATLIPACNSYLSVALLVPPILIAG